MNSHEAFMQTICANPDDDAPRLVYADWLEENGYELYAEFIRVQIELTRTGHQGKTYLLSPSIPMFVAERDALDPRIIALLERQEELTKKYAAWRRLPPNWPSLQGNYERGLLYWWWGSANQFMKYGEEIWAYGPVRKLFIEGKDAEIERFACNPLLLRINELRVMPKSILDRGGIALAQSKYLRPDIKLTVSREGKRISQEAEIELGARFGTTWFD